MIFSTLENKSTNKYVSNKVKLVAIIIVDLLTNMQHAKLFYVVFL